MTSWRDSVSDEASAEMEALLNAALPVAQDMVKRRGEFYPYAVTLGVDGETSTAAGDADPGERPSSVEALEALHGRLVLRRSGLRATAVVSDVRLSTPPGDAIQVEIEHREGMALLVVVPYTRKRFGRSVTYGELRAAVGVPQVWTDT
jgi:hypothetical protein